MRTPLLVGVLILGGLCGCTDGSTSAPTTIGADVPARSASSTSTPATTPPSAPTTTVAAAPPSAVATTVAPDPPPDGAAVLQRSLDQATAGYHFVTTATVNGNVALRAEGDRVGSGTRMRLE